jgi:hypothetical protein
MSPLGDAMGLVNGKERDRDLTERLDKGSASESLRRDVDEIVFSIAHSTNAFPLFWTRN